jgi:hypothetical protein
MFLSQIFDALTYGELSNLSLGSLEYGGVKPEHYPKLITNINSGMIELYKRFPLKTSTVPVVLVTDTTSYTIDATDILKIDKVVDAEGTEYPINDMDDTTSVFVPEYNLLQVPFATTGTTLTVTYRAAPVKLDLNPADPDAVNVPIPDSMLECIIAYVVSKIHASGPATDNNLAGMYYNKFHTACDFVERMGLIQTDGDTNTKFDDAGFV